MLETLSNCVYPNNVFQYKHGTCQMIGTQIAFISISHKANRVFRQLGPNRSLAYTTSSPLRLSKAGKSAAYHSAATKCSIFTSPD